MCLHHHYLATEVINSYSYGYEGGEANENFVWIFCHKYGRRIWVEHHTRTSCASKDFFGVDKLFHILYMRKVWLILLLYNTNLKQKLKSC